MRLLPSILLASLAIGCDPPESMTPAHPLDGGADVAPPDAPDAGLDAAPDDLPWPPAAPPVGAPAAVQWLNLLEDAPLDIRVDGWRAAAALPFGDATATATLGADAARVAVMLADAGPDAVLAEVELALSPGRRTLVVVTGHPAHPDVFVAAYDAVEPADPAHGVLRLLNTGTGGATETVSALGERHLPPGEPSEAIEVDGQLPIYMADNPLGRPVDVDVTPGAQGVVVFGALTEGDPVMRVVWPDGGGQRIGVDGVVRVIDVVPGAPPRRASIGEAGWAVPPPFTTDGGWRVAPGRHVLEIEGVGAVTVRPRARRGSTAVIVDAPEGPRAVVVEGLPIDPIDRVWFSLLSADAADGVDGDALRVRLVSSGDDPSAREDDVIDLPFGVPAERSRWRIPPAITVERGGDTEDFGPLPLPSVPGQLLLFARDPDGRPIVGAQDGEDGLRWRVAARDRASVRVVGVTDRPLMVRVPDGPDPFAARWLSAWNAVGAQHFEVPAGQWSFEVALPDETPLGQWQAQLEAGSTTTFYVRDGAPPVAIAVDESAAGDDWVQVVNESEGPIGVVDGDRVEVVPADAASGFMPVGGARLGIDTDGDRAADLWMATADVEGRTSLVYTGEGALPGAWAVVEGQQPAWTYALDTVASVQVVAWPDDPADPRAIDVHVDGVRSEALWLRDAGLDSPRRYAASRSMLTPAGARGVQVTDEAGFACDREVELAPDVQQVLLVTYDAVDCAVEVIAIPPAASRVYNAAAAALDLFAGPRVDALAPVGAIEPGAVGAPLVFGAQGQVAADFDRDGAIDARGPTLPPASGGLIVAWAQGDARCLLTVMPSGYAIPFCGGR